MVVTKARKQVLAFSILLAITLAAYWHVHGLGFVTYDDREYITENFRIQSGLSWNNVLWASTAVVASHWAPVTLLSHMVVCQLFGLNSASHHIINLALHITNVLLLFWVLQLATGLLYRSAFVAAIFSVHPLNVESVAWVAERKNVLSTLFLILTIWAYIRFARSPGWKWYIVVLACFTLGLMSKPMLVTVPFMLLLLDYWPLRRWRPAPTAFTQSGSAEKPGEAPDQLTLAQTNETNEFARRPLASLLLEKVPLLLLSIFSCFMTMRSIGDTLYSPPVAPLRSQFSNAIISYVVYLYQCVWPLRLAVFYPFRTGGFPFWQVGLAAAGLTAISVIALLLAKRFQFVAVGWFWYLGTLAPVIGFIQAGYQSRADRYTYVPMIGIFIILVWAAAEISSRSRRGRLAFVTVGGCILVLMIVMTRRQVSYWHDSITLFEHAEQVTGGNYVAYSNLGYVYLMAGRLDEAAEQYSKTDPSDPIYSDAQESLATVSLRNGNVDEAIDHLNRALAANPRSFDAYNKLGIALAQAGHLNEAASCFHKVIEIKPDFISAYANLGTISEQSGNFSDAVFFYGRALDLLAQTAVSRTEKPDGTMAAAIHLRMADLLMRVGNLPEAQQHFLEVLRINPNSDAARQGLARISSIGDDKK